MNIIGNIAEGAVIIFENGKHQFGLQLRDDDNSIPFPNYWGLFGGWLKRHEAPQIGIKREVREELGFHLLDLQLRYFKQFSFDTKEWKDIIGFSQIYIHVFHYFITEEFKFARIREGQCFKFKDSIEISSIKIIPYHLEILQSYFRKVNLL